MQPCSVLNCKNRRGPPKRDYFQFPLHNVNLLKKWINVIGKKNIMSCKFPKVCSDHFKETDYLSKPGAYRRQLKVNAVPSIFDEYDGFMITKLPQFKEDIRLFDLLDPLASSKLDQDIKDDVPVRVKVESLSNAPDESDKDDLRDSEILKVSHYLRRNAVSLQNLPTCRKSKRIKCRDMLLARRNKEKRLKMQPEELTSTVEFDLIDSLASSKLDQDTNNCIDIPVLVEVENLSDDNVKNDVNVADEVAFFSNIPDKDFIKTEDPLSLAEWKEDILTSNDYNHNFMNNLLEPPHLESHLLDDLEKSLILIKDVPNVQDKIGDRDMASDISFEDCVESLQIRAIVIDHNYALPNSPEKLIKFKDSQLSCLKKKVKCLQEKLRRRDQLINKLRVDIAYLTKEKTDLLNKK